MFGFGSRNKGPLLFVLTASVSISLILKTMAKNEKSVASLQTISHPPFLRVDGVRPYRAVVFGATGGTGKPLVEELINSPACISIVTAGRRTFDGFSGSPKLEQRVVQMEQLVAYRSAVLSGEAEPALSDEIRSLFVVGGGDSTGPNLDTVVFVCLGSTRKQGVDVFVTVDLYYPHAIALLAARFATSRVRGGVTHVSVVSSIGADSSSLLLYPSTKGQEEEVIIAAAFPAISPLFRISIFRPALLITDRTESRPAEWLFQKIQPALLDPLLSLCSSWHKFRSIQVASVAMAMRRNVESHRPLNDADAQTASPVGAGTSSASGDMVEVYWSDAIQRMSDEIKAMAGL